MKDLNDRMISLLHSIKNLREADDLSLQELSYLSGIEISRLSGIENSEIIPSITELESILDAFSCHLGILDDDSGTVPSCLKESERKRNKTIVVLGNGFDLALGLNTSYRQFIASDYWPLRNGYIKDTQEKHHRFSACRIYISYRGSGP